MRATFTLLPANGFVWNRRELVDFLIQHHQQEIVISTRREGVCLRAAGVYELIEQFGCKSVVISTNNVLESHDQYRIERVDPYRFFDVAHSRYSEYQRWTQQYLFGCFYNRPLWHRIGLAAELQQGGAKSLVSVRAGAGTSDERSLFEVQKLFEHAPESFVKFSQVVHKWPQQCESADTYTVGATTTAHVDQLAHHYSKILVDVVGETWILGNSFGPTEKTVRPMLLKKPMIVMAPQDYLLNLRRMGFRTFGDFWDESYDGYEGAERYRRILQVIKKLSSMTVQEQNAMYWDMEYTLEHNFQLLATRSWKPLL